MGMILLGVIVVLLGGYGSMRWYTPSGFKEVSKQRRNMVCFSWR